MLYRNYFFILSHLLAIHNALVVFIFVIQREFKYPRTFIIMKPASYRVGSKLFNAMCRTCKDSCIWMKIYILFSAILAGLNIECVFCNRTHTRVMDFDLYFLRNIGIYFGGFINFWVCNNTKRSKNYNKKKLLTLWLRTLTCALERQDKSTF